MPALLLVTMSVALAASPTPEVVESYESARSKVGHDSDAHVRLALWCEAHGLKAETLKHLAVAVLSDPSNATARGLLGLVSFQGKWQRPEVVSDHVRDDEALAEALAAYNAKRASVKDTADAHWKLGLWCEEKGLKSEAFAHFTRVTRLDPARDAAWKRLGCRNHRGRWVSEKQLEAERAEAEARKNAEKLWKPYLLKARAGLGSENKSRRKEAEAALAEVTDPLAVPSVWAVFAEGEYASQGRAVQVLGQIESAGSSRAIATLAVFGQTPAVRRLAKDVLMRRDPRDFVGQVIGLLRDPIRYQVRPVAGPGSPGVLFVEGKQADMQRVYGLSPAMETLAATRPTRFFGPATPFSPIDTMNLWTAAGAPVSLASITPLGVPSSNPPQTHPGASSGPLGHAGGHPHHAPPANGSVQDAMALAIQQDLRIGQDMARVQGALVANQLGLEADVRVIEGTNADIRDVNQAARELLEAVTGQELGDSPSRWKAWWTDQRGYVYSEAPTPVIKPVYSEFVTDPLGLTHTACFAAGTPVRTLEGHRTIEDIRIGDQVLSQDASTGKLTFGPVLTVFHNPPSATLRIKADGDVVVATGIHRFWKAGHGWTMARDLKPGDAVRTLGGVIRVESIEPEKVQPVFNLEVASGSSFFVGSQSLLVHDNSLVEPVTTLFDALPANATAAVAK